MNAPKNSVLIIIGSMKSGTTSLFNYLIQHPSICPSVTKEPDFFSKKNDSNTTIDDYLNLWDYDESKHKIAIEASTSYTKYPFKQDVPKSIYQSGLSPRFIYCVRNPFDRILSQYQFVNNNPNWGNINITGDRTISISKYYMQLNQFRKYFKKEDILIVDFDEIALNPQSAVNKVFRFVELPIHSIDGSVIYNKTQIPSKYEKIIEKRFPWLLKIIPDPIIRKSRSLSNRVTKTKQLELSEEDRMTAFQLLKEDMKEFQNEYGFDVSKWGF